MNKRDWKRYGKLFTSTFLLSAFTFGGGYVIVSLMKERFVDKLGWLEKQEMLDLTAIAQSAPGPIAVNAAILLGYRVGGPLGALVAILGTILPPFLILSVVSLFYTAFKTNRIIAAVLRGMQAGVAAVIASVVLDMAGDIVRKRKILPVLLMVIAFALAVLAKKLNVVWILLGCAAAGIASALWSNRRGGDGV